MAWTASHLSIRCPACHPLLPQYMAWVSAAFYATVTCERRRLSLCCNMPRKQRIMGCDLCTDLL